MRLTYSSYAFRGSVRLISLLALYVTVGTPAVGEQTCADVKPMPEPSYASPFGQQRQLTAQSEHWQIMLAGWEPSNWPPQQFTFQIKNLETKSISQITLGAWAPSSRALQLDQIDEIAVFGDKLLVLGRPSANSSEATVLKLPSGEILDQFPAFMPVASPGSRFVAFMKTFPGHPGPVSVSAEYLVYDLASSRLDNRPDFKAGARYDAGWPVYPPGAVNAAGSNVVSGLDSPVHWISSGRLFWLDAQTLVFTDRYPGENRLVVVNLSNGIRAPSVRTLQLDAHELIDVDSCRNSRSEEDWNRISADLSGLIRVQQISAASTEPGKVCLRLEPSPCLARSDLMLKLP